MAAIFVIHTLYYMTHYSKFTIALDQLCGYWIINYNNAVDFDVISNL